MIVSERVNIEARRARVAASLLSGKRWQDVAASEGVSVATISRDMRAVRAEWQAQAEATHTLLHEEFAKLRLLDTQAAEQFERNPSLRCIEVRLKISERLAKMFGLDSPEKIQHQAQPPVIEVVWIPTGDRRDDADDDESAAGRLG